MSRRPQAMVAVLCLQVHACTEASGSADPAVDAAIESRDAHISSVDADAFDAGDAPLCPLAEALDSCGGLTSVSQVKSLLEATTFGAGAEFIAAESEWVLVRGGGLPRAVRVPTESTAVPSVFTMPSGFEAIDVTSGGSAGGTFVLGCKDLDCQLFAPPPETTSTTLVAVPDSAFEAPRLPRGLVEGLRFDATDSVREQCVFGADLRCFLDGSWRTEIAPDPDQDIVDASFGDPSVAITESGGLHIRSTGDTAWESSTALAGHALGPVQHTATHPAFLMDGARWVTIDPDGTLAACALGQPFEAMRAAGTASERLFAVTMDHELVDFVPPPTTAGFCGRQMLGAAPVRAITTATCGIVENPRVLTRDSLVGMAFCAID